MNLGDWLKADKGSWNIKARGICYNCVTPCHCYFIPPLHSASIIHSFNKYLLSTYYLPGTVLYAEDTPVNKRDKVPAFLELMF